MIASAPSGRKKPPPDFKNRRRNAAVFLLIRLMIYCLGYTRRRTAFDAMRRSQWGLESLSAKLRFACRPEDPTRQRKPLRGLLRHP
jgi:hypothetical protein